MFGSLFGDAIHYKASIFVEESKENVTYLGVFQNQVYYEEASNIVSHFRWLYPESSINNISCAIVTKITDWNGELIEYDCLKNSYSPEVLNYIKPKKREIYISYGIFSLKRSVYVMSNAIGSGLAQGLGTAIGGNTDETNFNLLINFKHNRPPQRHLQRRL